MTSLDFLNISLAIGIIILTVFLAMVLYQIVQTIRTMRLIMKDVRGTTRDITFLKNTVKMGVVGFAYKLLGGKGGQHYERR